MRRNNIIFLLAVLLSFGLTYGAYIWYMDSLARGPHSIAVLSENNSNQLRLRIHDKPDFMKICGQFADMDKAQLEAWLQKPDRELNEVSFALHYLANRYLSLDSFETGLFYLKTSAELYLNPFSYLKMGQIYTETKDKIQEMFPNQNISIEQDLLKAYTYMRTAFALGETSMHYQGDNYIFNFVNRYWEGTMASWQEAQKKSQLNMETELESIEKTLTAQQEAYMKLYNLKAVKK